MKVFKYLILWIIGGIVYITIEFLWRSIFGNSHTHWSMFVVGGTAFVFIGGINEHFSWDMPIWKQVTIGTFYILALEFVSGCILNLWLKLNIWDYSNVPLNILGQICLPFAVAWAFLSLFAIILDDWLRYWLFGEEKPRYRF